MPAPVRGSRVYENDRLQCDGVKGNREMALQIDMLFCKIGFTCLASGPTLHSFLRFSVS